MKSRLQESRLPFGCTLALFIFVVTLAKANGEERIQFNRDVRPILSDKCFACHGPDGQKRSADLRLDDSESAINSGAIVPNDAAGSEALRRILSKDPEEQMPPPHAKLGELTQSEVEILRKWIDQGATFEKHWSFIPVSAPAPALVQKPIPTDLIDAPVKNYLANRSLEMQPEADRYTLIRRVTFDLTGLPPTIDEINDFVNDTSPNAYEKVVDRLLQSEHFGERMAVDWLDVSRYADSYGFQVDREWSMWTWRDWVIKSFNSNLPFDQFITWQVAGDMLPNATDEQVLATAFNRLHQQEAEGGSVEEEYRVEYVSDRVQTFATTFLGLTFECCRCHDHKYDPITQKEFYQLFAMFQNIDEAGLYSYFTQSPPTPTLWLADQTAKERLAQLGADIAKVEQQLQESKKSLVPKFQTWVSSPDFAKRLEGEHSMPQSSFLLGQVAAYSFDQLDGGKFANGVNPDQPATNHGENGVIDGKFGKAASFTGDDPVKLSIGNFKRQQPFSVSLWVKTPDVKERSVIFHRSAAWTDAASRGYELLIEEGKLKWSLIHFWPGNAISIRAKQDLPLNEWTHVVVTNDGSSRASGLQIFVNGEAIEVEVIKDKLTKEITGGGGDNITLAERFRDRGFKGGSIDEFKVFDRKLTALEASYLHSPQKVIDSVKSEIARIQDDLELKESLTQSLFDFYLETVDADWSESRKQLLAARETHNNFADGLAEIMVMRELPEPKKAFVLYRGEYQNRRDEVFANTPAVLPPIPEEAPKNRLGLAKWLIDRQHPLTSRVTINRLWQSFFGKGLVKTSEDFGSQGNKPVYQEVLDNLAWRFMESGWDLKGIVKTIVMSETYRQRSFSNATQMADDPENDLLARGPRFRLSAEMIRDNALAVSGLLNRKMGGSPVNPYEMTESVKAASPTGGNEVYRRSVYTNWRRTGPPPAMVAFDAPRRAVCVAKRERTDSPQQALILLNGEQYVEAARVLGESLWKENQGDWDKMIHAGFLRCLSRPADDKELEIVLSLVRDQRDYFSKHEAEADAMLKVGRAPRDPAISTVDAATAMVLAQVLLNHDFSVVKR